MKTMILDVEGMSCQNCVKHVTEALSELSGVDGVEVDLEAKQATMQVDDTFQEATARAAVDEAGYEVTGVRAA